MHIMDRRMVFEGPGQIQAARTKVIACATVIEEMLPLLPPGVDYRVLDFGLHVNPEALDATAPAAGRGLPRAGLWPARQP
jgi:hypothetical protein